MEKKNDDAKSLKMPNELEEYAEIKVDDGP